MRPNLLSTLVLLFAVTGCGSIHPNTPSSTLNVDGNWQIQASPGTSGPSTGLLLTGALQGSGGNISGTFSFSDAFQNPNCFAILQPLAFTGAVDSNSNLTLTSAPFDGGSVIAIKLPLTTTLTGFTTGTLAISGGTCTLANSPVLAAEFASLTGTFSGTLSLQSSTGPATTTGTAALDLAQSSTPDASGQFPVTASLNFTSGTCNQTVSLSGTATGSLLNLSSPLTSGSATLVTGVEAPDGTSLMATAAFVPQLCASLPSTGIFSGQLNRQ